MIIRDNMNKREYAFDILRTISMLMVIMIHVSNVYSRSFGIIGNHYFIISLFFNTICRISVPIFLMISGALLLDREYQKDKYLKRIIKFLLLIIIWDIIYLIWEYLYLGITYNNLYRLLFEPLRAHLWFLYTILLLYIIQPLLRYLLNKTNKTIKIVLLIVWLLFSSGSMISHILAEYFTFFSYMGFFIIGKYLYNFSKENDLKKYNKQLVLLMIILYTVSIILNYKSSIKYNMFYNLYFAYRTPFIMFSSIAFFLLIINSNLKTNKLVILLSDLSLGVYLIHGIFLDITVKQFIYPRIPSIIGIPLFTLLIFLGSIVTVYLIKKIKILNNII